MPYLATPPALAALAARRGGELVTLNLSFCTMINDAVLCAVAAHCGGLRRLLLHQVGAVLWCRQCTQNSSAQQYGAQQV